jgi:hypothetical protein
MLVLPECPNDLLSIRQHPLLDRFRQGDEERHENNHRMDECEGDVRPLNQADPRILFQPARTTFSCNTRKANNNKKKEETPNSVQSSDAPRS